jgi:hypothetical protein
MKTQTQNAKEPSYSRPRLLVYGNIMQITQAGALGGMNDNSGQGQGKNKTQ